jgi:hypothetical protein
VGLMIGIPWSSLSWGLTAVVCRSCRDKAARESEDGAPGSSWTAVGASAIDALGVSGAGTSSEWLEAFREIIDAR